MTELIFRLTDDELEVLQSLIQFVDGHIPDWMNEEAFESLFNKVMSN